MTTKLGGPRRRMRAGPLRLAVLLMLGSTASCTPLAVDVQPPVETPRAFSVQGTAPLKQHWWSAFDDEQLNALVEEALAGNFSLRVAWDRLAQSRAAAARSGAPLRPSLNGTAGASQSTMRTAAMGQTSTTDLALGLAASYEVDLWGRIRSARDAAVIDVLASEEDLHAAAVTLTAQVAATWYRLLEQRGQLSLLDEQIKTNEKSLELITLRFRRGQVLASDVLQQRQLVESTKGDRIRVESGVAVLQHQLALLVGRTPGSLDIKAPDRLPKMPALPETGLPAEWIRRRPDVKAAELRVQAADRRAASAIADQFPRLSLSVRAETSAEKVRDLFDNWLASLAANLVAPILDGGLRRAEVRRTEAVVSERLNAYGRVILTSLTDVEDALVKEAKQAAYVASLKKQLDLSQQATEQTRDNYTKGTTDFTRYLTTLLAHQRLQRTYLQVQRELVTFRIDLYRALGGSWPLKRPAQARVIGERRPLAHPAGSTAGAVPVE